MKSGTLHTYAGIIPRGEYVSPQLFSSGNPLDGEAFGATETRPCTPSEKGGAVDVCLLDGGLRHDGSRRVVKWLMPSEHLKLAWHGFAATGGAE